MNKKLHTKVRKETKCNDSNDGDLRDTTKKRNSKKKEKIKSHGKKSMNYTNEKKEATKVPIPQHKFISAGDKYREIDKKIASDPRFAHLATDPRYQESQHYQEKIKLDDRFNSMFTNEKFHEKSTLDPRGRPANYSTKENLRQFYHFSSSDESDETDLEELLTSEIPAREIRKVSTSKQTKQGGKSEYGLKKKKAGIIPNELETDVDLMRGGGLLLSDSSEGDSSTDEESDGAEFDWGEMDHDAQWDVDGVEVEETDRIAVCNMDWSVMKAPDLMMLLSGFAPRGGVINKVSIYLSEYGKKRLKEDGAHGPVEFNTLSKCTSKESSDDKRVENVEQEVDDQPTAKMREMIRNYQRNLFKYYYAIVECDSVATSVCLYNTCDRHRFEAVGVTMDLRYIPTDMEFDEKPVHTCTVIPDSYKAFFDVKSLGRSKPTLTWEDSDKRRENALSNIARLATQRKAYSEDLVNEYIGSGSSDDSGSDVEDNKVLTEERRAKLRSLLADIDAESKDKKCDDEKDFIIPDIAEDEETESDEGIAPKKSANPFQRYLDKRTEKNRQKKLLRKQNRLKGWEDDIDLEKLRQDDNDAADLISEDAQDLIQSLSSSTKKSKKKFKSKLRTEDPKIENEDDMELLLMEEEMESAKHFNIRDVIADNKPKSKQSRWKFEKNKMLQKKQNIQPDNFEVNLEDSRFASLVTSADFSVDPSDPRFKKTKAMENMVVNVRKKRFGADLENAMPESKRWKTDIDMEKLTERVAKMRK